MNRRPLPLMADSHQATQAATLQLGRIKRNAACTSCRDAKVRCNPSSDQDQPCQRCAKLHFTCLVDKTHKRISRRSKLDELAKEIQSIKECVGSASSTIPSLPNEVVVPRREPAPTQLGIASPSGTSSQHGQHNVTSRSVGNSAPDSSAALHTPATTLLSDASSEPTLPRTLTSYPFSGPDIDFYFEKYFEHYHQYMPVVRQREPNKCHDSCPLLFWTIIYVSSRRYAKSTSLVPFLSEEIQRQAFATLGSGPLSLHTINAMLLICSWNLPNARFTNDCSTMLTGAIANSALLLGLHTGRGDHPNYSYGSFHNSYTDEAVTYTWAGFNIVSQRVSSYIGLPPITSLFNQTIQNAIDGRTPFHVPSGFRVLLECQKFCNHANKIVLANLEESSGVSPQVIQVLEDEWDIVQGTICSERADDLDKFNALLVRLEIQTFYMMPAPGYSSPLLRQNILRAYRTACAAIRDAQELDRKYGFLAHCVHGHARSLMTAGCVIFKLLRSSYMAFLNHEDIEAVASDAIAICRRLSIVDGDLCMRMASLLRSFLEFYFYRSLNGNSTTTSRGEGEEGGVDGDKEEPLASRFTRRLGAGVTFDCLMRWKSDGTMERAQQQKQQPCNPPPATEGDTREESDRNHNSNSLPPSNTVPEPLAIDWTFMDDFEWNWTPPSFGPPVNLWHGITR